VKLIGFWDTKDGGDVTDWLDAGHTREQLESLIHETPEWTSPADRGSASVQLPIDTEIDDEALLNEVAAWSPLEYDKRRDEVAKKLGIRVRALDAEIKQRQAKLSEGDVPPLFDHWQVEPWPESVHGEALVLAIKRRIQSHVVLSDAAALVVGLWIIMTWAHEDAAVHSPILVATSAEPNSGKSTLLGVCQFLVLRPLPCVEISEATLFRSIALWSPTLLIDEGDVILVHNEALRAVMNSGWTRGQGVLRCVGDDHVPQLFSTFAPKRWA
jgi:putative DNA primase/helicase